MRIQTNIKVMNNADTGYDALLVNTECQSSISLCIPVDKNTFKVIELNRAELYEFLLRTQPMAKGEAS